MKVRAFTKTYVKHKVLDFPGYEFKQGKVYAILGANGSGKTTFAKIVAGVLKNDDNQAISIEGSVGYMPQRSYAFRMSTLENVMVTGTSKETALETMKSIGIDSLADKKGNKLSGGETARMALARLLVKHYDTVILDEPCASMDIKSIVMAEKMIQEYRDKENATIMIVTHSLSQAKRLADEILFFHEGKLMELSSKEAEDYLKFFD